MTARSKVRRFRAADRTQSLDRRVDRRGRRPGFRRNVEAAVSGAIDAALPPRRIVSPGRIEVEVREARPAPYQCAQPAPASALAAAGRDF